MNIEKMDIALIQRILKYQNIFKSLKENEPELLIIPDNYIITLDIRNNMIKWLIFLCKTLHFNFQTLLRAKIIFDKYISKINFDETLSQEKLNLITISCLSIATKIEEINCNYVSFFTEKVLNMPDYQVFTVKDLTKMEIDILKELKYKTIYTTSVDFVELYFGLFKIFFKVDEKFIKNTRIICERIMEENITNSSFVRTSESEYAFLCFNQVLIQLGMINNNYLIIMKNILINSEKKPFTNILNHSNEKINKINDVVSYNLFYKRRNNE